MPEEQLIAVLRAELSQFRAGMEEAARVAQQAMGRVREHSERAAKGIESLEKSLTAAKGALAAFGVTLSARTLVTLATDAVQAATRMQALEAAMRTITGSAGAAQRSLEFVRNESNRLGLEIESTAKSFQQLAASSRGTRLEGEETRRIFTAVANASRVLGLSVAETGGALNAIQQIISKGIVQAEELRGQLGERLPGAFQIAARAVGVTTAELNKMLEQGQVISEDFIPRFARQLQQEFAPGAEAAARSAAASFTRLANEIKVLSIEIGTSIISGLQPAADFVTRTLQTIRGERERSRELQREATGPPPVAVPDLGEVAPQLQEVARGLRRQIEEEQRQIAGLVNRREGAAFEAQRARFQEDIDERTKGLDKLRMSYEALLKQIDLVQKRFEEGGTEVTQIPFGKQAEGLQKILEQMRKDVAAVNMEFELFGQGGGSDVKLEAAKRQLQEIEKATADIVENLAANPRALEAQVPSIKAVVAEVQRATTAARARVQALEDEEDAVQKLATEEKKAAREAAAETERLAEKRVKDLKDEQKEQVKTAEAAKKAAFEEIKARAEVGVAEQEYLKGQAEAQEKLDVLAGRAQSRFDAERARVRQQIADIEAVVGVTEETQRVLADNLVRIQREQTAETERELKKQNAAYEQFAENVQKTVGDRIFDVLSGRVRSFNDLLGSIKDTFLRVLADMAAAALARPIIIPAITAVLGAVGLGGLVPADGTGGVAGASGGGGGGTLNTLLSLGRTGQQLYSLAGKLGLLGSGAGTGTFAGSTSFLGATAPTAFYATTPAAAATIATGGVGAGAGSTAFLGATAPTATFATAPAAGATVASGAAAPSSAAAAAGLSAVVGGVGAGVGTGLLASQLLGEIGLKGTGNAVLSGAAGGATAGFIIGSAFPVIGNVVGAIAGALIGAIGGFVSTLFGGQAPPGVHLRGSTGRAPQFGVNEAGQIDLLQGFRPDVLGRQIPRAGLDQIGQAIDTASIAAIEPLIQTLRQFPESFQRNAVGPLNDLGQELKSRFADLRFSGDDVVEQVQKFLEETLPTVTQEVFDPFVKLIERLAPIYADLDTAIKALEQRRNEILADIIGVRATIIEGTLTPERLFARRRGQFDELLSTFRGATPEQQAALAPQVSRLAEDVFRQAQGLFREDTEALFTVQQDLLAVLDEVEFAVRKTFLDARDQIDDQIDVLNASFAIQQNIEAGIAESVALLQRIAALLTPIGSFQTAPGEFRRIPRTGLALVHEGEIIGRRGGGMATVTINIDARGSNDAAGIGRESAAAVRQTIRSLQQTSRYRQDRGR